MKKRSADVKQSQLNSYGMPSLNHRLKLVLLTCCTKITVTASQINKIWEPLNVVTCVQRL